MTRLTKLLAGAALAGGLALAAPAAAQVAGIATSTPEVVIARANALNTGYQQINTTYAAQIRQIGTARQEAQTLLKSLDTNNDNQLSDAERAAKPAVITQIQQKEQQINTLATPITLAQAYVIDQLVREYGNARQQVISAKNIQILLSPDAIQYAPPAIDVTTDIVNALNTRKPTVTTAVPAGWQPTREVMQLQQTIQQLMLAAAQQQAATAQQGQAAPAATTPAPTPAQPRPRGR